MEKIFITYSPSGKTAALNLSKHLSNEKFAATAGAGSLSSEKKLPEVVVAVFTEDSDTDTQMIKNMDFCTQKGIRVVPFQAEKLSDSVGLNYFFDEHIWIDGAGNFTDGCLDLTDLLKKEYSYLSKRVEKKQKAAVPASKPQNGKKSDSKSPTQKESLYVKIIYICAAVIVVLLFILVNGGLKQSNREADNYRANASGGTQTVQGGQSGGNIRIQLSQQLKNSEQNFVGRWKLLEYSDNQFRRTREDSLNLQQLVNALIDRAEMIFKDDKTFSRVGFSETPETGNWEYDPQSKYLKLQPSGKDQFDVVQIQTITQNRMIIVVQEKLDNQEIFTKLTFQKQ